MKINVILKEKKTLSFTTRLVSIQICWEKLQTNTIPQTISLVSTFFKLFSKLISRVCKTRFWTIQIGFVRLDFQCSSHEEQTQTTKGRTNPNYEGKKKKNQT